MTQGVGPATGRDSLVADAARSQERRGGHPRSARLNTLGVVLIVAVQTLCAFFFVSDILSSMIGLQTEPLNWRYREFIEIGAAGGLILGLILGAAMLQQSLVRSDAMEQRLRAASSAFMDLLNERFTLWRLTPAERDVAMFSIKGFSTQEIAKMRATSEGTVKAQTNAIYRKAGVSGRSQLLSLFIDDLMAEDVDAAQGIRPAPLSRRKG